MVMCFKQQAVIEFFLEEKDSVTNIHIQLKKMYVVSMLLI